MIEITWSIKLIVQQSFARIMTIWWNIPLCVYQWFISKMMWLVFNYVPEVLSYWPVADVGLWNVTLPICKLTLQANINIKVNDSCSASGNPLQREKPISLLTDTNNVVSISRNTSWVNKVTFDCQVHCDRSSRLCSNVVLNFCFWIVVDSCTAYLIEVVRSGIKRNVSKSSGKRVHDVVTYWYETSIAKLVHLSDLS